MNTFQITADYPNYQSIHLEMKDILPVLSQTEPPMKIMQFSKNNLPLSNLWQSFKAEFKATDGFPNSSEIPDITQWTGATLVLSVKAKDHLSDILDQYGEFLPINTNYGDYFIFNCLEHLDNIEASSQQAVFKTQHDLCRTLYCSEEFKDHITKLELHGIKFCPV